VSTPVGDITYRAIDHQSTMGAFVGTIALKDGKGTLVDWSYKNGGDYTLPDEEVMKLRGSGN
jgi:branched-chain amino acid transport system substrate-binding protein